MSMRSRTVHVMVGLAVAAFVFVGTPSVAQAQHHGGYGYSYGRYGHSYGYSGYGYGGYGYGYGRGYGYGGYGDRGRGYRGSYGSVRIEVSPKASRGEAQVFVNGAHVGTVDDFDGFFQRLRLDPGAHAVEIRLSGHRSFRRQILVSPGNTYKIRHEMETLSAGELSGEAASYESAEGDDAAPVVVSDFGAVRIDVGSDKDRAQVYVDGAHAGTADDFDGSTPLWLAPGTYELEIRLDGHRPFKRRILVTPGNTYELQHRMESVPGASPPR